MQPGDDAGPGTDTRGLIVADEIDPVQFGRLLESQQQLVASNMLLSRKLDQTGETMKALDARIVELESRYRVGKGVIFGVVLGAGFAAKGVVDTLKALATWN